MDLTLSFWALSSMVWVLLMAAKSWFLCAELSTLDWTVSSLSCILEKVEVEHTLNNLVCARFWRVSFRSRNNAVSVLKNFRLLGPYILSILVQYFLEKFILSSGYSFKLSNPDSSNTPKNLCRRVLKVWILKGLCISGKVTSIKSYYSDLLSLNI